MTGGDAQDGDLAYWRSGHWWRRVGVASSTSWVAQVLALVGSLIAARGLGPTQFGVVVLGLATATAVTVLFDITLEDALVFFGIRDQAGDGLSLRPLFRKALSVDLAVGAVVTLVLVAAAGPLTHWLTDGQLNPDITRLAALVVFVSTVDGTTGAALLVAKRPDLRGWSQVAKNGLRVAFLVPAVAWGGARAVLLATAAAYALGALLQLRQAQQVGWRRWPASTRTLTLGPVLRFAALSTVTASVVAVTASLVPVMLGRMFDTRAVALFAVALAPLQLAAVLTAPVRMAILPEQTRRMNGSNVRGRQADVVRLVLAAVAASALILAVGWPLLPRAIKLVYGGDYADAAPLARTLLFAVFASNISSVAKLLAVSAGRPGVRAAVSVVDLAGLLVLVGLLAHRHGLGGAAAGYAAASTITACVWFAVAWRMKPRPEQPVAPKDTDLQLLA